ncbi:hypothetical protein CK203_060109 [Vitis vinifera]|uniref:Uncharacterized protein n=1 Tax=Vitis vinifera TaxID=29760 RepID=A0A438GGI6_VITVI|nr:hypothetical protein CK203_116345 [Vitis vinifera]RVW71319.1 hypothetical protein CK203_060109 [Vitis vinifera]
MLTPSKSRSSTMGSKGYFNWRESMERSQLKSERQMQALLCKTRRLKEENEVLRIQLSSSGPPRSQQPRIPTIGCNARKARASNAQHGGKPHVMMAQEACPGPSTVPVITDWLPHSLVEQPVGDLVSRGPPNSICRQLDDMLSMPFSPYIINYEPPRGFVVPKFSMYDESSDPFDHIDNPTLGSLACKGINKIYT